MNHPGCHRRQQILEAAQRLLAHYGPSKTTVADIAREAQVGVGTVYLEFASKDAIIEELSGSVHGGVLEAMRGAASRPGAPFAERLGAIFEARVEAFFRLTADGTHAPDLVHCVSPVVREVHLRFQKDERAVLVSFLREAAEAGAFDLDDVERAAEVLIGCHVGFSPPSLFARSLDEARRSLGELHRLVLRGLLPRR